MSQPQTKPESGVNIAEYSISPANEKFKIPQKQDFIKEYIRVEELVNHAREEGKEIVVVMGIGFVGAVMAAIIADVQDENGSKSKFVIGCQRPSARSYWKIPMLNRGNRLSKPRIPK